MYINIHNVKHQIGLRKHLPEDGEDIGSMIRHQRRKMNLTLEEGAEGNCSVSYLSKVENNQIISC